MKRQRSHSVDIIREKEDLKHLFSKHQGQKASPMPKTKIITANDKVALPVVKRQSSNDARKLLAMASLVADQSLRVFGESESIKSLVGKEKFDQSN